MYVITSASQKGGAGKTTLCRNLAVATPGNVALLDTDPQGSLSEWWNQRKSETPVLIKLIGSLRDTIEAARVAGYEYLFIDTPPSAHPVIGEVIALSDLVIVPVRPTPDDLRAVGPTLDLIEEAGKRFIFVVTQAKPRTRLAADTVPALAQHGKVSPAKIFDRTDYPTAAIDGRGVTETAPSSPASDEIRSLLKYVITQLPKEAHK